MIYLSDEQSGCLGVPRDASPRWELISLPLGPNPLPEWAKGLHVDFMDSYGNDPGFVLKTDRDLRRWDDMRFRRDGDLWIAESGDGRAEPFYQGGPLRIERLKRFRHPDGRISTHGTFGPNPSGEWIEVERPCTRQEEGVGGTHVDITMIDGTEVTLRGPWHGPCPAGYVEVTTVDTSSTYFKWREYRQKPWWARGGRGIATIRSDVFIPIFARYAPHLRLAAVDLGRGVRLQPLKPEWDEPKTWVRARERMTQMQAAYDAMKPEERPPHVACNWPKVCGGKPHCAVAACNHCTPRVAA